MLIDRPDYSEWGKLDYSRWGKNERDYIEALIKVLSDQTRSDLETLVNLAKGAPDMGIESFYQIELPAVFSIIAFQRPALRLCNRLPSKRAGTRASCTPKRLSRR